MFRQIWDNADECRPQKSKKVSEQQDRPISIFAALLDTETLNQFQIFWEYSPAWLAVFFLLSLGVGWWQYGKGGDWPKSIRLILWGLRSLLLFLLLAFLLNPLIKNLKKAILPPVTALVLDNSRSVALGTSADSLAQFTNNWKLLRQNLEKQGIEVVLTDLSKDILPDSSPRFDENQTALDQPLRRLKDQLANQNLTRVILASDGIFNKGQDPTDQQYPFRIQTIRLGNPLPRKDLQISGLRHNQVAFLGNMFPVVVQVRGRKLAGTPIQLELFENGKIIQSTNATIKANELGEAEFQLKAQAKGLHQYQVQVKPVDGELTEANNRKSFYIDVVDGKQKVLVLASAGHPDIKAIRNALEPLEQLELTTIIGGKDDWKPGAYNLIILHQLPDRWGSFSANVSAILKGNTPTWVITGTHADLNRLRMEASEWITIQGYGNGTDEVAARYHPDFQRFTFEENWKKTLESLPPVNSPTAVWNFKGNSDILLQQKLGKAISPNPLMAIYTGGNVKRGVFWGDGLWLWRMNEYALNQKTEAVDNLIQKTVQLLLSSEKKQRLKVYLTRQEWYEGEQPAFIGETYNAVFESVYDQKIDLEIKNDGGKKWNYSFYNHASGSGFPIEALPEGKYKYLASCQLNGKTETDGGEFVIRSNELENQDLEARHALLQQLASSHEGISVGISGMSRLWESSENEDKPLIEFSDWHENLLNKIWILWALLGLALSEWAIRKWYGTL